MRQFFSAEEVIDNFLQTVYKQVVANKLAVFSGLKPQYKEVVKGLLNKNKKVAGREEDIKDSYFDRENLADLERLVNEDVYSGSLRAMLNLENQVKNSFKDFNVMENEPFLRVITKEFLSAESVLNLEESKKKNSGLNKEFSTKLKSDYKIFKKDFLDLQRRYAEITEEYRNLDDSTRGILTTAYKNLTSDEKSFVSALYEDKKKFKKIQGYIDSLFSSISTKGLLSIKPSILNNFTEVVLKANLFKASFGGKRSDKNSRRTLCSQKEYDLMKKYGESRNDCSAILKKNKKYKSSIIKIDKYSSMLTEALTSKEELEKIILDGEEGSSPLDYSVLEKSISSRRKEISEIEGLLSDEEKKVSTFPDGVQKKLKNLREITKEMQNMLGDIRKRFLNAKTWYEDTLETSLRIKELDMSTIVPRLLTKKDELEKDYKSLYDKLQEKGSLSTLGRYVDLSVDWGAFTGSLSLFFKTGKGEEEKREEVDIKTLEKKILEITGVDVSLNIDKTRILRLANILIDKFSGVGEDLPEEPVIPVLDEDLVLDSYISSRVLKGDSTGESKEESFWLHVRRFLKSKSIDLFSLLGIDKKELFNSLKALKSKADESSELPMLLSLFSENAADWSFTRQPKRDIEEGPTYSRLPEDYFENQKERIIQKVGSTVRRDSQMFLMLFPKLLLGIQELIKSRPSDLSSLKKKPLTISHTLKFSGGLKVKVDLTFTTYMEAFLDSIKSSSSYLTFLKDKKRKNEEGALESYNFSKARVDLLKESEEGLTEDQKNYRNSFKKIVKKLMDLSSGVSGRGFKDLKKLLESFRKASYSFNKKDLLQKEFDDFVEVLNSGTPEEKAANKLYVNVGRIAGSIFTSEPSPKDPSDSYYEASLSALFGLDSNTEGVVNSDAFKKRIDEVHSYRSLLNSYKSLLDSRRSFQDMTKSDVEFLETVADAVEGVRKFKRTLNSLENSLNTGKYTPKSVLNIIIEEKLLDRVVSEGFFLEEDKSDQKSLNSLREDFVINFLKKKIKYNKEASIDGLIEDYAKKLTNSSESLDLRAADKDLVTLKKKFKKDPEMLSVIEDYLKKIELKRSLEAYLEGEPSFMKKLSDKSKFLMERYQSLPIVKKAAAESTPTLTPIEDYEVESVSLDDLKERLLLDFSVSSDEFKGEGIELSYLESESNLEQVLQALNYSDLKSNFKALKNELTSLEKYLKKSSSGKSFLEKLDVREEKKTAWIKKNSLTLLPLIKDLKENFEDNSQYKLLLKYNKSLKDEAVDTANSLNNVVQELISLKDSPYFYSNLSDLEDLLKNDLEERKEILETKIKEGTLPKSLKEEYVLLRDSLFRNVFLDLESTLDFFKLSEEDMEKFRKGVGLLTKDDKEPSNEAVEKDFLTSFKSRIHSFLVDSHRDGNLELGDLLEIPSNGLKDLFNVLHINSEAFHTVKSGVLKSSPSDLSEVIKGLQKSKSEDLQYADLRYKQGQAKEKFVKALKVLMPEELKGFPFELKKLEDWIDSLLEKYKNILSILEKRKEKLLKELKKDIDSDSASDSEFKELLDTHEESLKQLEIKIDFQKDEFANDITLLNKTLEDLYSQIKQSKLDLEEVKEDSVAEEELLSELERDERDYQEKLRARDTLKSSYLDTLKSLVRSKRDILKERDRLKKYNPETYKRERFLNRVNTSDFFPKLDKHIDKHNRIIELLTNLESKLKPELVALYNKAIEDFKKEYEKNIELKTEKYEEDVKDKMNRGLEGIAPSSDFKSNAYSYFLTPVLPEASVVNMFFDYTLVDVNKSGNNVGGFLTNAIKNKQVEILKRNTREQGLDKDERELKSLLGEMEDSVGPIEEMEDSSQEDVSDAAELDSFDVSNDDEIVTADEESEAQFSVGFMDGLDDLVEHTAEKLIEKIKKGVFKIIEPEELDAAAEAAKYVKKGALPGTNFKELYSKKVLYFNIFKKNGFRTLLTNKAKLPRIIGEEATEDLINNVFINSKYYSKISLDYIILRYFFLPYLDNWAFEVLGEGTSLEDELKNNLKTGLYTALRGKEISEFVGSLEDLSANERDALESSLHEAETASLKELINALRSEDSFFDFVKKELFHKQSFKDALAIIELPELDRVYSLGDKLFYISKVTKMEYSPLVEELRNQTSPLSPDQEEKLAPYIKQGLILPIDLKHFNDPEGGFQVALKGMKDSFKPSAISRGGLFKRVLDHLQSIFKEVFNSFDRAAIEGRELLEGMELDFRVLENRQKINKDWGTDYYQVMSEIALVQKLEGLKEKYLGGFSKGLDRKLESSKKKVKKAQERLFKKFSVKSMEEFRQKFATGSIKNPRNVKLYSTKLDSLKERYETAKEEEKYYLESYYLEYYLEPSFKSLSKYKEIYMELNNRVSLFKVILESRAGEVDTLLEDLRDSLLGAYVQILIRRNTFYRGTTSEEYLQSGRERRLKVYRNYIRDVKGGTFIKVLKTEIFLNASSEQKKLYLAEVKAFMEFGEGLEAGLKEAKSDSVVSLDGLNSILDAINSFQKKLPSAIIEYSKVLKDNFSIEETQGLLNAVKDLIKSSSDMGVVEILDALKNEVGFLGEIKKLIVSDKFSNVDSLKQIYNSLYNKNGETPSRSQVLRYLNILVEILNTEPPKSAYHKDKSLKGLILEISFIKDLNAFVEKSCSPSFKVSYSDIISSFFGGAYSSQKALKVFSTFLKSIKDYFSSEEEEAAKLINTLKDDFKGDRGFRDILGSQISSLYFKSEDAYEELSSDLNNNTVYRNSLENTASEFISSYDLGFQKESIADSLERLSYLLSSREGALTFINNYEDSIQEDLSNKGKVDLVKLESFENLLGLPLLNLEARKSLVDGSTLDSSKVDLIKESLKNKLVGKDKLVSDLVRNKAKASKSFARVNLISLIEKEYAGKDMSEISFEDFIKTYSPYLKEVLGPDTYSSILVTKDVSKFIRSLKSLDVKVVVDSDERIKSFLNRGDWLSAYALYKSVYNQLSEDSLKTLREAFKSKISVYAEKILKSFDGGLDEKVLKGYLEEFKELKKELFGLAVAGDSVRYASKKEKLDALTKDVKSLFSGEEKEGFFKDNEALLEDLKLKAPLLNAFLDSITLENFWEKVNKNFKSYKPFLNFNLPSFEKDIEEAIDSFIGVQDNKENKESLKQLLISPKKEGGTVPEYYFNTDDYEKVVKSDEHKDHIETFRYNQKIKSGALKVMTEKDLEDYSKSKEYHELTRSGSYHKALDNIPPEELEKYKKGKQYRELITLLRFREMSEEEYKKFLDSSEFREYRKTKEYLNFIAPHYKAYKEKLYNNKGKNKVENKSDSKISQDALDYIKSQEGKSLKVSSLQERKALSEEEIKAIIKQLFV